MGKYFVPAICISVVAGLVLSGALVYYQQYLEGIAHDDKPLGQKGGYTTALAGYNYYLYGIIGGSLAAIGIALFIIDHPPKLLQ